MRNRMHVLGLLADRGDKGASTLSIHGVQAHMQSA